MFVWRGKLVIIEILFRWLGREWVGVGESRYALVLAMQRENIGVVNAWLYEERFLIDSLDEGCWMEGRKERDTDQEPHPEGSSFHKRPTTTKHTSQPSKRPRPPSGTPP